MQKIIINCKTGQAQIIDLTPKEEADRLAEVERNKASEEAEQRKRLKRQAAQVLTEIREMKQNRDLFDDEDIAEKQAEVSRLKEALGQ